MPRELNLDTLRELDFGIVQEAFQRELARVVQDIEDRPTDTKVRKVAINFLIGPVDTSGDEVDVECEIVSTVPKRVSKPYRMRTKRNGTLLFEPNSPENPDQLDLDSERERKQGK